MKSWFTVIKSFVPAPDNSINVTALLAKVRGTGDRQGADREAGAVRPEAHDIAGDQPVAFEGVPVTRFVTLPDNVALCSESPPLLTTLLAKVAVVLTSLVWP